MNLEGKSMMKLAAELWPLNRSLSGEGTRESLRILKRELRDLQVNTFESGSKVFDWVVPPAWNCHDAYILTPEGRKICDFSANNLHLVGYSEPTEASMTLAALQDHLFSLPEQPEAIPYVTSYYKKNWGFCLSERDRSLLVEGEYKVIIRSEFSNSGLDTAS